MSVQMRSLKVHGRVSIDRLEDIFGEIYEKNEEMSIENPEGSIRFVDSDSEEKYDLYEWKDEDNKTRVSIIVEDKFQKEIVPRSDDFNIVIKGDNIDKTLSRLREGLDKDVEFITTSYSFHLDEPILPAEGKGERDLSVIHHWEGKDSLEDIAAPIGETNIDVLSSIEDEDKARRELQKYLENLRSRDDWPPSPMYRQLAKLSEVRMDTLREEFDVSEDNSVFYIGFDSGTIGITKPEGQYEGFVVSDSYENFEKVRENIERIVKTGALEMDENPTEQVVYNNDDIVEVGYIE